MAATVFESRNSWCQKNKNLIATNISGFKKIPRIIFWLLHSNKNRPKKTWVVHVLKGNAGAVAHCARPLVLHEAVGARKVPLEPLTERSVAIPLWEILWFHWTHFLSLNRVNFFFFFFWFEISYIYPREHISAFNSIHRSLNLANVRTF